jgi:hypothetical protein
MLQIAIQSSTLHCQNFELTILLCKGKQWMLGIHVVFPTLQDGKIFQQAVSNQLNYNNEHMGTSRLQRGLSGGLDDILVDMFRPV